MCSQRTVHGVTSWRCLSWRRAIFTARDVMFTAWDASGQLPGQCLSAGEEVFGRTKCLCAECGIGFRRKTTRTANDCGQRRKLAVRQGFERFFEFSMRSLLCSAVLSDRPWSGRLRGGANPFEMLSLVSAPKGVYNRPYFRGRLVDGGSLESHSGLRGAAAPPNSPQLRRSH